VGVGAVEEVDAEGGAAGTNSRQRRLWFMREEREGEG
jgi:hypothetical protein